MGLLDFLADEYSQAKNSFGLLGDVLKGAKRNPDNLKTIESIKGLLGATPGVGDVIAADDAINYAKQGQYGMSALAGVGALPLIPSMVGMVGKGAKIADPDFLKAANATKSKVKTQYELAHEIAQKNAALPAEKGGLGLPPNNTAMDRAKAMGFDTQVYHGTASKDFLSFDNEMLGATTNAPSAKKAHFFSGNPETAQNYIEPSYKQLSDAGLMPQGFDPSNPDFSGLISHKDPEKFVELTKRQFTQIDKTKKDIYEEFKSKGKPYFGGVAIDANELGLMESKYGKISGKKVEHMPSWTQVTDKEISRIINNNIKKLEKIHSIEFAAEIGGDPRILPLMINTRDLTRYDFSGKGYRPESYSNLLEKSKDGFIINNTYDGGPLDTIYAVKNPSSIRSRFAAFDPMKRKSSDILGHASPELLGIIAGGGLLGISGNKLANQNE